MELNWGERFDKADVTGSFTKKDCLLISSFRTCFLGELFPQINSYTYIIDDLYYELGMDAYAAIHRNDVKAARRIWNELLILSDSRKFHLGSK